MPTAWTDDGGTPLTYTSGGTGGTTLDIALGTDSQNAAGRLLIVAVSFDNSSTNNPSVTSITKPAGETNSWVALAVAPSSQSGVNAGCITELWAIETSVNWDGHTVSATISATRNARTAVLYRGIDLTSGYTWAARTAGTGTSTSGAPSATVNSVVTDDLVLYAAGHEGNTNPGLLAGYTSGGVSVNNNGTATSSNAVRLGFKAATSSANVTVSPSCNGDSNVGVNALHFTAVGPSPSDLTGAATTVNPTASGSLAGFNDSDITGAATTVNPTASGSLSAAQPTLTGDATTVNPTASGLLNSTGDVSLTGAATTVNPTAAGSLTGFNDSDITGAATTENPTASGSLSSFEPSDITGAATTENPTASGSLTADTFTCLDLSDAIITWSSATLVGGEIVAASGVNPEAVFPTPVMVAGHRYDIRVRLSGGETATGDVTLRLVTDLSSTPSDTIILETDSVDRTDPSETIYHIGTGIDTVGAGSFNDAVGLGYQYLYIYAPVDSTIEAVCWQEAEVPPEIIETDPVEDDTDILGVDPVDQGDHETEWHTLPTISAPPLPGMWEADDVAFIIDADDNKVEKRSSRLRDVVVVGVGGTYYDISFVNGKRTKTADYQRMKPFSYGPGSLAIPGLNAYADDLSTYPWLPGKGFGAPPWVKVFVFRVNEANEIVKTDYRGRADATTVSGADVSLRLGGMFSGPASVQWRPKPLIRRRRRPTYWLHAMFRKNQMPLEDIDLGFDDVTSPPQGWHLNCALETVAGAVKRNGDALTVSYDEVEKQFVSSIVDRETIHATIYADHNLARLEVTQDFAADTNQVYASGYDEDGGKILFAVAPGMQQVDPVPDFPIAGGTPFGVGTVDADTVNGDGVSALIFRLILLGFLKRDNKEGGFDADCAKAVADARVEAKLSDYEFEGWWGTSSAPPDPLREKVDEDLWAWLWDSEATGYTLKEARIRPAYEVPELGKYDYTATGQFKDLNDDYDPSVIPVSEVVDFTTSMHKGQMRRRARRFVESGPNWAGTLTTQRAFIDGEHNVGDPFDESMIVSNRDIREGQNIWVPNFDGGTLFHVSGIDVSDDGFVTTFMVDTRARDTLKLNEIITLQAANRLSIAKQFWHNTSSQFTKHTLTGDLGEIGGIIGADVIAPAGQWTVVPCPLGDFGLVEMWRLKVRAYQFDAGLTFEGSSPNASSDGVQFAAMAFGEDVRSNNNTHESAFLDNRRPDPFASGDFDDYVDATDDFKDKRIVAAWGGQNQDESFSYCGYGYWGDTGGTPSGNFFDDAGHPFRAPNLIVYIAIFPEQDAVILSGKAAWWQRGEGT